MSTTAISAVVPRTPTMLVGRVAAVVAHLRPWVRLNVELCDGTGTITLRFMGRTEVPGIVPGCCLRVEGTPWWDGPNLIVLNPLYAFVVDGNPVTA